jgi:hypothetical protein
MLTQPSSPAFSIVTGRPDRRSKLERCLEPANFGFRDCATRSSTSHPVRSCARVERRLERGVVSRQRWQAARIRTRPRLLGWIHEDSPRPSDQIRHRDARAASSRPCSRIVCVVAIVAEYPKLVRCHMVGTFDLPRAYPRDACFAVSTLRARGA